MTVTVFYDSSLAQSLISAWSAKIWSDANSETISFKDTKGLSEGDTDTLIATISAASQDRIYSCVSIAAGHVAGNLTDDQILTLNGKIAVTSVAPYDEVVPLGDATVDGNPAFLMWNELYPDNTPPRVVQYLAQYKYPEITGTATSIAAGTINETGAFTIDAEIGKYVYIISATTGKGQVRLITDNTADQLVLESNWTVTPTGTVVYGIVSLEGEVLYEAYLGYYVITYMNDLTSTTQLQYAQRLIDSRMFTQTTNIYNQPLSGSFTQDITFLNQCIATGKNIFDYTAL